MIVSPYELHRIENKKMPNIPTKKESIFAWVIDTLFSFEG